MRYVISSCDLQGLMGNVVGKYSSVATSVLAWEQQTVPWAGHRALKREIVFTIHGDLGVFLYANDCGYAWTQRLRTCGIHQNLLCTAMLTHVVNSNFFMHTGSSTRKFSLSSQEPLNHQTALKHQWSSVIFYIGVWGTFSFHLLMVCMSKEFDFGLNRPRHMPCQF